jgi:hypothetical protein
VAGWYVPRALGERGTSAPRKRRLGAGARTAIALIVLGSSAGISACGGGERQDASEPSGNFPVEVTEAKFPNRQRLAETTNLELQLKNIGDEQVPELAVTIFVDQGADGSFFIRSDQPGLANPNRPVWILEQNYPKLRKPGDSDKDLLKAPPAGADVAQTNTFAFGPVAPGGTVDAVWRVTPVKGGTYTVNYEIAAGLNGNAKAVTADGGPVTGSFVVTITTKPPQASVNAQGKVVIKK